MDNGSSHHSSRSGYTANTDLKLLGKTSEVRINSLKIDITLSMSAGY
jgi:hypothetical protein